MLSNVADFCKVKDVTLSDPVIIYIILIGNKQLYSDRKSSGLMISGRNSLKGL